MLVLSRRSNEKIVFPELDITVQLISAKSGLARLGITAPPAITVLREELCAPSAAPECKTPPKNGNDRPNEVATLVGKRLAITDIGLAILDKQLEDGLIDEAKITLERIRQDIYLLERRLRGQPDQEDAEPSALVVEDDCDQREMLAEVLRVAGMKVATAGDGADALDHLRTKARPDFVLLDMLMPRCDGVSTARAIRRDPACSSIKIFALTGHSPQYFGVDANSAGINRWFRKPIDPQVLLRELQRELDLGV
jgi:carbon storage regulator CsrA